MKRPLLWTFLASIFGIVIGKYDKGGALLGTMICLVIVLTGLLFVWKKVYQLQPLARRFMVGVLLVIAMFCVGAYQERNYHTTREEQIECLRMYAEHGKLIKGTGKVRRIEEKEYAVVLYIKNAELIYDEAKETEKERAKAVGELLVYVDKDSLKEEMQEGTKVFFEGRPASFERSRNEGNYDEEAYAYSLGWLGKVKDARITICKDGNSLYKAIIRLKLNVEIIFDEKLRASDAGVAKALVLGKKEDLSAEDEGLFYAVGAGHILAISGLHLNFIGMGVYACLLKMGVSFGARCIFSGMLAFLFSIFSGSYVSAIRGVSMFITSLGSSVSGRRYDFLSSMGLAGTLLLLWKPYALFQLAFQYSFLAILGVEAGRRVIKVLFLKLHPILQSLIISLCAWLLTLPLTLWNNFEVPWVGIILNVIVLPLMTPVLAFVFFGTIIQLLANASCFAFLDMISQVFFHIFSFFLNVLRWVCKCGTTIPFYNVITGKPSIFLCAIFYILLMGVLLCVMRKKNWKMLVLLPVLVFALIVAAKKKPEPEVVMLDVGQGDGIYLSDGYDAHFFVDGGSSDISSVGKYRILPFLKSRGIRVIDGWFVSHCDADHISGLIDIIQAGYQIKRIYLYQGVTQDASYDELVNVARDYEVEILHLATGDGIETKGLQFICLNPSKHGSVGNETYVDKNQGSMVLLVTYKCSGLKAIFAGDIGVEVEYKVSEMWNLEEISIWKATHHGSKYSNGENILKEMRPIITLLSCGQNNRYGHPHEESLERIKRYSKEVYRTDECGQISITMGKELQIRRRVP